MIDINESCVRAAGIEIERQFKPESIRSRGPELRKRFEKVYNCKIHLTTEEAEKGGVEFNSPEEELFFRIKYSCQTF